MRIGSWKGSIPLEFRRKSPSEETEMNLRHSLAALAVSLLAVPSVEAQIVSGVMTVTGAEMH
jgi:hypothetical protein